MKSIVFQIMCWTQQVAQAAGLCAQTGRLSHQIKGQNPNLFLKVYSRWFLLVLWFTVESGIPSQVAAQWMTSGTSGVVTQPAVVNVTRLARRAALAPATPVRPRMVHPPLPGPRHRAVPPGARTPSTRHLERVLIPSLPSPEPVSSFPALEDNNTAIPPDTHGAVGPNHLMVTLNTQVRIQNRAGGTLLTLSLNSFWASLGNPNVFDPKVLYDPYGNRWVFTACADPAASTSSVLLGVSQTSDPTGSWALYRIDVDPADLVWADYPSIGFNKDWVVVQMNMFTVANDNFDRSNIYVINKADLYVGGTIHYTLLQDSSGGFTQTPALTYDPTQSIMYLVEDWNGNFEGNGYLRLSTITGPVGSEVLTVVEFPSTSNPWAFVPFNDNFAPQLGSAQKINNGDSRMQNLVYRNGSLWCAHTVFLPADGTPTRSAAQWWKLSPGGAVEQQGRIDDATGATFYAYPSIAVNKDNDVLIGYTRFSTTQYPSANYAFRAATDPANTFRADMVLKAGEASYFKDYGYGTNRWGDYSNTVVDPVNDTVLWTIQEYAATPSQGSDRWGTWWGSIAPPPVGIPDTLSFAAAFARPGGQAIVDVRLRTIHNVSGLQFKIQPNQGGEPIGRAHFNGLINNLESAGFTATAATDANGVTTVLLFSTSGAQILPGDQHLLDLVYDIDSNTSNGEVIDLAVWEDVLSDPNSTALSHILQTGRIQIGRPGDLTGGPLGDGDGHIDILDLIKEIQYILGFRPMPEHGSFTFFVADANGDRDINVLDLIWQINQILSRGTKPLADGPTSPVTVSLGELQALASGQVVIPVTVTANGVIAGVQAVFTFDPAQLQIGSPQLVGRAAGMTLQSQLTDGKLRLVVYSATGQGIPAGSGTTLLIPVMVRGGADASPTLTVAQVVLANHQAQSVPVMLGTSTVKVQALPKTFALHANRPNPFNPSTRIAYDVPQAAHITLAIYNLLGQEVVRLVDGVQAPGRYVVSWNGKNGQGVGVASGVYLYRLTSSTGFTQSRRMTLVK